MTEPATPSHGPERRSPIARFLVSGFLNTLLTYLLYLLLLGTLGHRLAYTIAFACGIVLAYVLNRSFVFKTHAGWRSALAMPIIYLMQYALGLTIIELWVSFFDLPPGLGPLAAVAITLPAVFVLSRLAFSLGQPAGRKDVPFRKPW